MNDEGDIGDVPVKATTLFPCPICGKPCRRSYYTGTRGGWSLDYARRQPCAVCHNLERHRYYKRLSEQWLRRYHEAKAKREQRQLAPKKKKAGGS